MPKGAYKINNDLPGPGPDVRVTSGKDASFAACIASLLVFFSICIIIVLATRPWSFGPDPHDHHKPQEQGGNSAKVSGGRFTTPVPVTLQQGPDEETTDTDLDDLEGEREPPPGHYDVEQDDVEHVSPTSNNTHENIVHVSEDDVTSSSDESTTSVPSLSNHDEVEHVNGTSNPTSNNTHENIVYISKVDVTSSVESTTLISDSTSADGISETSPIITSTTTAPWEEANLVRDSKGAHSITVDHEESLDTDDGICKSGECKALASRMLSMLNHSMDMCNDFYEYACGGLRHSKYMLPPQPELRVNEKIREGMSKVTPTSPPHYRQFMHFYESCLTYQAEHTFEQRVHKARTALSVAGTLHDRSTWHPSNETIHLTLLLATLFKMHSTPLFDVLLDVSSSGRGSFSLRLTPPLHRSVQLDVAGFGHTTSSEIPPAHCYEQTVPVSPVKGQQIDLNDAYKQYTDCTQNFVPFLDGVDNALKNLGAFDSLEQYNRSTYLIEIRQLVNDVLDVKKEHLPKAGEVRRKILGKEYTLTNISALQDSYTIVDWRVLIQNLLNESLPDSTQVQLYFPDYFDHLFEELSTADVRQTNNMLLGLLAHELYTRLVAENPTCDRASLCLETARTLMEDVAAPLYLASFPPAHIEAFKIKSHDLFSRIKQTLAEELRTAKWLDEDSRASLLIKLADMSLELGTERNAFSPERTMYQIPADADFFDMFLALLRRLRNRMYADYWSAPQSAQQLWSHFSTPMDTSGTAIYGLNTIMLPLGVYSMPHFYPGAPHYIHLATLGSLIAHEIAHHFDSTGVNFNAKGQRDFPQLKAEATKVYEEIKRLAEEQYNYPRSFRLDTGGIAGMQLNSELTLNERLADLTASHVAQATYETWLAQDEKRGVREGHRILPWLDMTWRQAFFVAQAQTYCEKHEIMDHRITFFEQEHFPAFERVNDMVRNSKQFAEAFSCVGGQQMNLELKIPPFPAFDVLKEDEIYFSIF